METESTLLGGRVRALREERRLSQEELGRMVGVGQGMIGHVESGRRLPSVEVAVRLARVLDVSLDQLLAERTHADELQPV